MADKAWKWAELSENQLRDLRQAEQTLGADILLAFEGVGEVSETKRGLPNLQAAQLNESQMECLRGTEDHLKAVVVAYKRTG